MGRMEIRHIRVRRGALDLELAVALDVLHVSEEQADCVLSLLPNLSRHVCVNEHGDWFGDEIVGTELPHLLEHIIIELEGQACGNAGKPAGHSSWLEELGQTAPEGYALMRTTVTFSNDFVALQALKEALAIIDWVIDPRGLGDPDSDACSGRIRARA